MGEIPNSIPQISASVFSTSFRGGTYGTVRLGRPRRDSDWADCGRSKPHADRLTLAIWSVRSEYSIWETITSGKRVAKTRSNTAFASSAEIPLHINRAKSDRSARGG